MTTWLWLRMLLGVYTVTPSFVLHYLEHDDHMALVENVAGRVHCDPGEMLDFLWIPAFQENIITFF